MMDWCYGRRRGQRKPRPHPGWAPDLESEIWRRHRNACRTAVLTAPARSTRCARHEDAAPSVSEIGRARLTRRARCEDAAPSVPAIGHARSTRRLGAGPSTTVSDRATPPASLHRVPASDGDGRARSRSDFAPFAYRN